MQDPLRKGRKNRATRMGRRSLTSLVRREVLTEAGFMCANPRCRAILTLEIHHIEWVKDDGGNEASNLLALCANCHELHTRGQIPRSAIEAWKLVLQLVNESLDRDSIDLLLFLFRFDQKRIRMMKARETWEDEWMSRHEQLGAESKLRDLWDLEEQKERSEPPTPPPPFELGGDGLLRLARLITAGLVDAGSPVHGRSPTVWWPTLTKLGGKLATAWLAGDAATVRETLRGQR